jgi:hypothetical protein
VYFGVFDDILLYNQNFERAFDALKGDIGSSETTSVICKKA